MHELRSSFGAPFVDSRRGTVNRRAFVSEETLALEIDRIFNRTWIFLAHESELPKPGSYVSRYIGDAPVVVVRADAGTIRAFLNSCRHRGTQLCRAESGQLRFFVCPYHGWTYDLGGRLLTTTFDKSFPEEFTRSQWSLVPVPRLESYHGLIFGCWDADCVPLTEYLGDMRWYLDALFARSPLGTEALAPPHRWRVNANWKVGALNFLGDSQHVFTTHVGPLTLNPQRSARAGLAGAAADRSRQITTNGGHGCTLSYLQPGLAADAYQLHSPALEPYYDRTLQPEQREMLRGLKTIVGTLFPNFSFLETKAGLHQKSIVVRIWHPINANETEIVSWVLCEREAPSDYKASILTRTVENFGVAGVFEQDDIELWASGASASNNSIATKFPFSFHAGLTAKPMAGHAGPGRAFQPVTTEVAQLEFMHHWDRVLAEKDAESA